MKFKSWLEMENKGYDYYKNLVLGKLNLDPVHGLTQSINGWEPQQLIGMLNGLGEFKQLPMPIQDKVISRIRTGEGNIGDLIQLMSTQGFVN